MTSDKNVEFEQVKSDQFAEKLVTILNYGAVNLMISVGYRTGLFDVMSELPPSTSHEIAEESGLDERYVREWLATMFTGEIIEYNEENKSFSLPKEHAAWLTRKATPNNIAVTAQWLPVLAGVEDKIVECFKNGGGVHYEHYNRFNEVMADESYQTVIVPLFDELLPLVPGLTEKLNKGIEVLDLGCGSGKALKAMAKEFPNSNFTGYDFLSEVTERALNKAKEMEIGNIHFEAKDAAKVDDNKKFDLITTFDAIHDQADPGKVLSNIFNALKDDGVYFMQDIAGSSYLHHNAQHPLAPLLYATSAMHCMTVSLAQGGEGLGAMWGKELACDMLKEAGFTQVEVKELPHDPINYYYIVKK
ncbi:MAG: class I SAM-dependent methyltransferase [Thermodesulfobacteriota bacterium]